MTARGDRKGLCLFDSDMPLRQRSELIGATVTAIGRSLCSLRFLEAKVQQGWHCTLGKSASDVVFVVTRCAALSNSSLAWRFVELVRLHNGDRGSFELTQVMVPPEKVHANSTLWLVNRGGSYGE